MPNQEETNETEWEARERAGEIPFNQEGKESVPFTNHNET